MNATQRPSALSEGWKKGCPEPSGLPPAAVSEYWLGSTREASSRDPAAKPAVAVDRIRTQGSIFWSTLDLLRNIAVDLDLDAHGAVAGHEGEQRDAAVAQRDGET